MDIVGVYNWIMFAENNSGGATVWLRTCDQEVASSIPGQGAAAYDDSGQVVHTQMPRRWHSSLVYRAVKLRTFTLSTI